MYPHLPLTRNYDDIPAGWCYVPGDDQPFYDFAKACFSVLDDKGFNADGSKCLATIIEERDLQRQLEVLVATPQPFQQITLLDRNAFSQRAAGLHEVGAKASHVDYDKPWCVIDAGIWTDYMGPCITVGLTAMSAGKRCNILLHSFMDYTGEEIIKRIIDFCNGDGGIPLYNSLVNVTWFVVGGSPDCSSLEKAVQLATELRKQNLPVLGVQFTTGLGYKGMAKAVLITATGQVFWTF